MCDGPKNIVTKNPLISVITVTYNDSDSLELTIKSVLAQTMSDYEFIVVDGGSTDNTSNVLNKYEFAIDKLICEKDDGIYDAMNKGVKIANGDYVIFMNAGDCFFDRNTLRDASEFINNKVDIVTGVAKYDTGMVFKPSVEKMMYKNQMHHQATFYSLNIFYKYGFFDLDYKVLSDFDFNLRCFLNGVDFCTTDLVISLCSDGGVSTRGSWKNYKEEILIRYKNIGICRSLLFLPYTILRYMRKRIKI